MKILIILNSLIPIEFLLNFKCWNKDGEWIKENAESFADIDKFISKHN